MTEPYDFRIRFWPRRFDNEWDPLGGRDSDQNGTSTSWWHYNMETLSAPPALCEGNPPLISGSRHKAPVKWNVKLVSVGVLSFRISRPCLYFIVNDVLSGASIHEADGRLIIRSREVSKPGGWYYDPLAPDSACCWGAWQASERLKKFKPESRGFETSRDLVLRRPLAQWIEALYRDCGGMMVLGGV